MANPKSVLRNLYGEIIQGNFSNKNKFKALINEFGESADVDKNNLSEFDEAIDNLSDNMSGFTSLTDPILEKIYEWFKEKTVVKKPRQRKTVWEKMIEDNNPGLTKHKKNLQRRKKH